MASDPAPPRKRAPAVFFATHSGAEPVREFLLSVEPREQRVLINADIRTAEYGWPIGMPTCRALGDGLHEIRTNLPNRIARVLFYVDRLGRLVLRHGFVKKTQGTPAAELALARRRKAEHERSLGDER